MIISVLLSCAVIAFFYYYVIHFARYRRLINLIPGKPQIPIIGDVKIISQCWKPKREEIFEQMINRCKKYGSIHKVWCFLLCIVSISHPDDIQVIMNNTAYNTKSKLYNMLHAWLNDGLLISNGRKWQERRKILTPAFHFNVLKDFFNILMDETICMIHSVKNMNDSTIENLMSFISHHTLNIISETSMGVSLRNINELEQTQYRQAIHNMGDIIIYRFTQPWMYPDMTYKITPTYRKEIKCLKILHGFTEKIIKERKQYHKATGGRYLNFENNAELDKQTKDQRKCLPLLDVLLHASTNNHLSDLDIREEIDTFTFEGHDTVATTLIFAILLLAEHKDVQDRVRNEVDAVMEENGGKLTMAALQNLTYLERCLKESMRLYPSVYFVMRRLEKDAKLRSYVVPAGVDLHINIYSLHRDPEFWPNPEVFDPDRFLPEFTKNRHPFAYIPFSAGSRNCIGQRFAMMELKIMLGMLVHNFHFEAVDRLKDIKFLPDMLLRPSHPVRVKFISI